MKKIDNRSLESFRLNPEELEIYIERLESIYNELKTAHELNKKMIGYKLHDHDLKILKDMADLSIKIIQLKGLSKQNIIQFDKNTFEIVL